MNLGKISPQLLLYSILKSPQLSKQSSENRSTLLFRRTTYW